MKARRGGFTLIDYSEDFSNRWRVLFLPGMKRQIQLLLWVAVLLFGFSRDTTAAALDNWHVRNTGPNRFSGLIFANDLFVAASHFHPVMTSPDGVNWTSRPSGIARLARG